MNSLLGASYPFMMVKLNWKGCAVHCREVLQGVQNCYFVFALTGAVLLSLYQCMIFFQAIVFSVASAFVVNTWFHARPTLTTAIYSPGVVSACLFNQIVFLLLLIKAHNIGILSISFIVVTLILEAGVFPLIVHVAHVKIMKDDDTWPWLENLSVARHIEK